jgi:hypothetical protein
MLCAERRWSFANHLGRISSIHILSLPVPPCVAREARLKAFAEECFSPSRAAISMKMICMTMSIRVLSSLFKLARSQK